MLPAAASPVASCTPVVSSTILPAPGPPAIHATADSPTSTDKLKKGKLFLFLTAKEERKIGVKQIGLKNDRFRVFLYN